MAQQKKKGLVVAKDAIVVVVGAKPVEYGKVRTFDRRRDEWVEIDNQDVIVDPGEPGVPYAFRPYQKVSAKHPAVLANPSAFMPLDDLDESEAELVSA